MAMMNTNAPRLVDQGLAVPYVVAVWMGMPKDEIRAGLRNGTVAPPVGEAADWLPAEGETPAAQETSSGAPVHSAATTLSGASNAVSLTSTPFDTVSLTSTPLSAMSNALGPGSGFPLPPRPRALPSVGATTANTIEAANDPVAAITIDRDAVHGWLSALDPDLITAAFDAIWERAGTDDSLRANRIFGYLGRTLLGDDFTAASASATPEATNTAHAALTEFVADPDHRLRVVDLSGKNGAELAQLARNDLGYRYALAELDSIALCGNRALFAAHNANGKLDRFNGDTGEVQISDAWLADRAKFLAWKLAADDGQQTTIDGEQSWSFVDRAVKDTSGSALEIELVAANGETLRHQVIFGTDDAEVITGRSGTDRIYGGGGDDVLRGGAGADRIEGGQGDDLVMGSAGADELFGNQGDDEIDGSSGADRLSGGGGTDTLTGGRGNDRLEGGEGNDTYVIDAGDGVDTIVDADGLGSIMLDGAALTGVAQNADGLWISADGRVEFAFSGEAEEGGVLTIRAFDGGADHDGRPANVIRLRDWHNGDLGIALGDGSAGALAQSEFASDSAEDERTDDVTEAGRFAAGYDAQARTVIGESEVWSRPATPDGALGDAGYSSSLGEEPIAIEQLAEPDAPVATSAQVESAALDTAVSSTSEGVVSDTDVSSPSEELDFDAALAELLGTVDRNAFNATATGVDLQTVSRAVEAFSGVLEPPDISAISYPSFARASIGVSADDIADALAADGDGELALLEPPIALDARMFGTGREISAPLPIRSLPTSGIRLLRDSG